MISLTLPEFWACFYGLPVTIQKLARVKHRLWLREPFHKSLHFKLIARDVWSVRINRSYRALARRNGDRFVWFWIGSHSDYNQMIS